MTAVDQAEQMIRRGGRAHFVGIGGIGMAGLAWLLKERGWQVSGCDLQENRQTRWLTDNGIQVASEHASDHVRGGLNWVIRSTAVPDAHPEVQRARSMGIPVSRRGEVLPALMRDRTCIAVCGTHGKTTTTAMIAQMLDCGYCVGGEIKGIEAIARDDDLMVVEADESDGTVAGYTPDYSVITNIEYDHMEHHASAEAFIDCFAKLIQQTGKKVFYRADDPVCRRLCSGNPKCEPFSLPNQPFPVSLPGRYNQWNAAAAVAVARQWRGDRELAAACRDIKPLRRRFETVMHRDGIRIVSDYAHHPTEIAALIETARELKAKRILAVFQPHRYTRTQALGKDFPPSFDGVEQLWLTPVYAASEEPLPGGSSDDLFKRFSDEWAGRIHLCSSLEKAWDQVIRELRTDDLLLLIGAGDIEQLAEWAGKWRPGEGSNLRPQD